jgi:alkylation response protein AidB-like acyl-CoA dehydrogenase
MGTDAQERAALVEAVREAASAGPRGFLDDSGKPRRDDRLWMLLSTQMGLTGLLVPDEYGGAGAGVAEVAVVLEQLSRALAVVPALSSLGFATAVLRVVGGPAASPLLERLAAGQITATVAWPEPESPTASPELVAAGPVKIDQQVTVSGRADFVLDGNDADVVLAPVQASGTTAVVAVDTAQPGVGRVAMDGLDLTRGLSSIEFTDASASVIGTDVDLQPALDIALVLIAAEQVGTAQQCHDAAVAWAKERIQFDRPIGQFQAIKHQLVDLLMALELGRSSLDVAVEAADEYLADPGPVTAHSLAIAASAAKARCGDAAMLVADQSLHILGGIGFTWEHDAHLYFRRAKTLEVLLGSPAAHRRRFATMLLEAAASA